MACQTCHIPAFARVNPTKMQWDWSSAGKMKDGKPFATQDALGKPSYDTKKGDFIWARNVQPEYHWFNGSIQGMTARDTIDPSATVKVNLPLGDPSDPNARIFPFKVHRGKQPYDKINKTIVIPKLFGPPDSEAYWAKFDWKNAITVGMNAAGLPFSGEYDFVSTSYVFPTTHMVAPKDKAVSCQECHTPTGSRLAGLSGVYMPGRDASPLVRAGGWTLVIGALAGVLLHGLGRAFSRGRKEG